MPFDLKDIPQLDSTASTDKDSEIAIAVPTGVGDTFNLRAITKEDIFRIPVNMAIRVDTQSAARDVFDFGSGRKVQWIGAVNALREIVSFKQFAVAGGDPTVQIFVATGLLQVGNASQPGTLAIQGASGIANVSNSGTGSASHQFREGGVIQVNPITASLNNAQLAAVSFEVKLGIAQWAAVFFNLNDTVAELEIEMPASPQNGWRVSLYFGGDSVTSITHIAPGDTTVQAPLTSAADGDRVTYIYASAADTWFPIS